MENNLKDETKSILHRITSPWFFTFIPWWVVFNYDFLLIVFGKIQVVYAINHHYCMVGSIRYTIAGCIPQISVGFWHWVFYTPWVTKLALPMIATIFSMTVVAFGIRYIEEVYHSIIAKDWIWKKKLKYRTKKLYNEEQDFYINRQHYDLRQYEDTSLEDIDRKLSQILLGHNPEIRHLLVARYKKRIEKIINTKNENPSNSN